jgi:hypothetical protein
MLNCHRRILGILGVGFDLQLRQIGIPAETARQADETPQLADAGAADRTNGQAITFQPTASLCQPIPLPSVPRPCCSLCQL